MRDSDSVYIIVDRPQQPIYHRHSSSSKRSWCGQRLFANDWGDLATRIRLGHARFFARPCKFCWDSAEAPRSVPYTTHLAWRAVSC